MSDMQKDKIYMELAFKIAELSKDESTHHGCVVIGEESEVLSIGYNGPVRGALDSKIPQTRPEKYLHMEHAERNAIYNAARIGISLKKSIFYVTGPPCPDCLRGIIQVGATEIIYGDRVANSFTQDWYHLYKYYEDLIYVSQFS